MAHKLYLNKQVSDIVGITPRQVQHWTDKAVVNPAKEASRGGTKRGYNYLNLIEFGLVKNLYNKGQGIQSIKKMLGIIRDRNEIKDWVDDYLTYFKNVWLQGKSFLQINDPKAKEFEKSIQRMFAYGQFNKKTTGVLVYFFSGIFNKHPCILPMVKLYGDQEFEKASHYIYSFLTRYEGALLINIGKIREDIDKRLMLI